MRVICSSGLPHGKILLFPSRGAIRLIYSRGNTRGMLGSSCIACQKSFRGGMSPRTHLQVRFPVRQCASVLFPSLTLYPLETIHASARPGFCVLESCTIEHELGRLAKRLVQATARVWCLLSHMGA